MNGCRSLTAPEIFVTLQNLETARDKCLFLLGIHTGFRISELLSITVKDVVRDNEVLPYLRISKRNRKGKTKSHTVLLHEKVKPLILELSKEQSLDSPLFRSPQHLGQAISRAITRDGALQALKKAFKKGNIEGVVATHSMRKTFAKNMYAGLSGDLNATRAALGHAHTETTARYLEVDQKAVDRVILSN